MGRIISSARPIRKPAPPKNRGRGRPVGTRNPEKDPTMKFIMTVDMETYNELARGAMDTGMTVQQYMRFHILKPWREQK